jgi:hypothetical protein
MARQRSGHRALVTFQVFLAIGPVVFLSFFMGPLVRLRAVDAGFETRGLYTGSIGGDYRDTTWHNAESIAQLVQVVRSAPGVRSAAVTVNSYVQTSGVEVDSASNGTFVTMNGRGGPWNLVSAGYFDAMEFRLVAGRLPTDAELAGGAPLAVVSEHTTRALMGRLVTGWRVRLAESSAHPTTVTVIGVVADAVPTPFARPPNVQFYTPLVGAPPSGYLSGSILVRGAPSDRRLVAAVYEALHREDSGMIVVDLAPGTLSDAATIRRYRGLILMVVASFGVAIGLAAVGIYGIIGYAAVSRRKELAIRVALGAARRQVAFLVTREALLQATIGALLGIAGGYGAVAYMAPSADLAKTPPVDLIGAACATLFLVLGLASLGPIRRVWHTDTATVLREDG